MKPYEKLLQFWRANREILGKPASPTEITALEDRFGVRFPEDFRDYLLNALPGPGVDMDANRTTWWGVSRIAKQAGHYRGLEAGDRDSNPHKYLVFSDFLIESHDWAIACGETEQRGKIVVLDSPSDRIVADDFATFVDLNIADDDSLC
jgi:hypothetical protein